MRAQSDDPIRIGFRYVRINPFLVHPICSCHALSPPSTRHNFLSPRDLWRRVGVEDRDGVCRAPSPPSHHLHLLLLPPPPPLHEVDHCKDDHELCYHQHAQADNHPGRVQADLRVGRRLDWWRMLLKKYCSNLRMSSYIWSKLKSWVSWE